MNEQSKDFHDPSLKTAVRRAIRAESAPLELRAKVERLLASPVAATSPRSRRWVGRWFPGRQFNFKTAAAVGLLLGALTLLYVQAKSTLFPSRQLPPVATTSIPVTVMVEMIRTHDSCAKLPDHHLIPGNDIEKVRAVLSKEEGVSVALIDLGAGWQFKGAGLCGAGSARTAHAMFARGNDLVSIFSMPAPTECGQGATGSYRQVLEGHPVEAVVHSGVLYSVIGSRTGGEMKLEDLDPVLALVQGCVGMPQCSNRSQTSLASR
jgi:hypothetical protein